MDDSMSDRPHIADRIMLEEGTEHCVEGNRSLLIGQFGMRAGNASGDLRVRLRGGWRQGRQRERIETSSIERGQPHRRAACVHHQQCRCQRLPPEQLPDDIDEDGWQPLRTAEHRVSARTEDARQVDRRLTVHR